MFTQLLVASAFCKPSDTDHQCLARNHLTVLSCFAAVSQFNDRAACFLILSNTREFIATAILNQETDEPAHHVEISRVNNRAPFSAGGDNS